MSNIIIFKSDLLTFDTVIGATNLDKVLDPALTRSGRFDLKISLRLPDAEARRKLVQHYLKKTKTEEKLEARKFATNLIGYSPVAIENLINQAALKAANDGDQCIKGPCFVKIILKEVLRKIWPRCPHHQIPARLLVTFL